MIGSTVAFESLLSLSTIALFILYAGEDTSQLFLLVLTLYLCVAHFTAVHFRVSDFQHIWLTKSSLETVVLHCVKGCEYHLSTITCFLCYNRIAGLVALLLPLPVSGSVGQLNVGCT